MREDLEYGCKKGRFRLKLEGLCYPCALWEEEEKGNLGNVVLRIAWENSYPPSCFSQKPSLSALCYLPLIMHLLIT
jgi:hypothetical protein